MTESGFSAREILELLSSTSDENGLFFVFWDEVRESNLSKDNISGFEGLPDLSRSNEQMLAELEQQGSVEYLQSRSSDQGKQYRITSSGKAHLEKLKKADGVVGGFRQYRWWLLLPLGVIGTLIWAVIDERILLDEHVCHSYTKWLLTRCVDYFGAVEQVSGS